MKRETLQAIAIYEIQEAAKNRFSFYSTRILTSFRFCFKTESVDLQSHSVFGFLPVLSRISRPGYPLVPGKPEVAPTEEGVGIQNPSDRRTEGLCVDFAKKRLPVRVIRFSHNGTQGHRYLRTLDSSRGGLRRATTQARCSIRHPE